MQLRYFGDVVRLPTNFLLEGHILASHVIQLNIDANSHQLEEYREKEVNQSRDIMSNPLLTLLANYIAYSGFPYAATLLLHKQDKG